MINAQKKLSNLFYAILALPATAMGFALSIQIAALSWILNTKYGFDIHEVGIVWAAGPLAGIIAQPIVGAISDNIWFFNGRRKPFIIVGGILTSLMLLALPNMDIIGNALGQNGATLSIAIAIAIVLDLSINISFNPTRSIIADVTPQGEKRTNGYTWMQTISGSFGVLAYAIGAIYTNYHLIYLGVILVLIFSILPTFLIEEPRELASEQEGDQKSESTSLYEIFSTLLPLMGFLIYGVYVIFSQLSKIVVPNNIIEYISLSLVVIFGAKTIFSGIKKENDHNEFQKILLAHSFTWWGVQTMFVYMFAYVQGNILGFGASESLSDEIKNNIGSIIAVSFLVLNLVGALLPALVLGPISEKIGRVKVHLISIAIMALGYFLIVNLADNNKSILYVLMAVVGIGWASTISIPFAIMSERVNQKKMGLYMGIFNLSVVLPQLVASFKIGELIKEADDKNMVFKIAALTLAISALLWISIRESKKINKKAEVKQSAH